MALIVEADGGSRGNPGPAGFGAVVFDAETGRVLAEIAESIGVASNNVAEYRGLIAGLTAALAIDPRASVDVRMDSRLVVEQMAGNWRIKHPDMRSLAAEAAGLVRRFPRVGFTHIPRERNTHADRLANEAMDRAARRTRTATRDVAGWRASPGPATTLVLLRHGATEHSAERRFSGTLDLPLTEAGLAQARLATAAPAMAGLTAVVSSPLRRARSTADTVAATLRLPVVIDDDLRETDFGEWEGATFAEVAQRWPRELAAWRADPAVAPPGGESVADTERRVVRVLRRLLDGHPAGRVLLVSHVTPIKILIRLALDAPPEALFRMQLDPAGLSVLDEFADGTASLRLFNDTGHLAR